MKQQRITLPPQYMLTLVTRYVTGKFREQVRSVAFIIIYLLAFQMVILGSPGGMSLGITLGIIAVILGLTLFMEGLTLGLMPLGETVGLLLPGKSRLFQVIIFGLLIGFISTLAEPAISILRTAGSETAVWEAPVLFHLLERSPGMLIGSVGVGVGLAVAASLIRYQYGFSLKPFILITLPIVLGVTLLFTTSDKLSSTIALAWDTGAVTTGPVTVPLVLALSIGVARASGKQHGTSAGFGSIALASLFPVLCVMLLSFGLSLTLPDPMDETSFFSAEHRDQALVFFPDEQTLEQHAYIRGSEDGRRAFYEDEQAYRQALSSLAENHSLLAGMSLSQWLAEHATEQERKYMEAEGISSPSGKDPYQIPVPELLQEESVSALRAVIPLTGLLLFVLLVLLKQRPRYTDEFLLGIALTLVGMALLTTGIRIGLAPLGDTLGRQLPRMYQVEDHEQSIPITGFDKQLLYEDISLEGERQQFFYLRENGETRRVLYAPDRHDPETAVYTYTRTILPAAPAITALGIAVVLIFAFGLGYGSTLAEPALNALGRKVEEMTIGTVRRRGVIRAVSVGVGVGLVLGVLRILYELPITLLIVPLYLLLIPLTVWTDRDFVGVSWDSGGVTTGPVTVPLVMALGLGMSGAMQSIEGFGILAMASVCPILSVQVYGFLIRLKEKRTMKEIQQEAPDEQ